MKLDCREEEAKPNPLLIHPERPKVPIDPDDIDGLIDALEAVQQHASLVYRHRMTLEDALAKHVEGLKTKTRRVQGDRRKARVEMPSDRQDNATLKKIVEDKRFKVIWPQLIRVSQYGVKMREFNKAKNTKGTDEWNAYRDAVARSILPPTARPRVVIEE